MRIANLDGRLVLKYPDGVTDVEKASNGRFAADPQAVFARWDEFVAWAGSLRAPLVEPSVSSGLKAPAPCPSQVFAIGLNYADHAGGAAGVVVGVLATIIYATARNWTVVIPALAWGGGVASAVIIGGIAGLLPALRAARLSPAEALRTV